MIRQTGEFSSCVNRLLSVVVLALAPAVAFARAAIYVNYYFSRGLSIPSSIDVAPHP